MLGSYIFSRDPTGMVPTDVGTEIIARSRTIMNEFRRLEEQVKQIQGEMVGSIRIVVSPLAAIKIVPLALSTFKRKHPNVRVHIDSGQAPTAFAPLRRGDADLVIAPTPSTPSEEGGLSYSHLFSDPLVFITGGTSKFASTEMVSGLVQAQWLMFGPKEREHIILGYLSQLGVEPKFPLTCSDSVLSVMGLLVNSDMVCTCPLSLFEELRIGWNIVQIPITVALDPIEISVITSTTRPPTSAALAFKEVVLQEATHLPFSPQEQQL